MLAKRLAGGGKAVEPAYIEDVFSTWLYTGNGSTQTITNGIDLAGKGGLVWMKGRTNPGFALDNVLFDTNRGIYKTIRSNSSAAESTRTGSLTAFNSNGFSVGNFDWENRLDQLYVSWTFRKQPKFFDVVTWTGNGANPRQIAHNLGSVPGCIIVKSTTRAENWTVYHRSLGNTARMALNTTDAQVTGTGIWASTTPTSTHFTVSADNLVNFNGDGYVAYIFAHNAGGFGLTGTDNVISCGSYVGNGSASNPITLGYEPQWILLKNASAGWDWVTFDNMRGVATLQSNGSQQLVPNNSSAESTSSRMQFNATGFNPINNQSVQNELGSTYIYIAIRRGPMKTPTSGTSVYNAITRSGNSTATTVTGAGFTPDLVFEAARTNSGGNNWIWFDRLRGGAVGLSSDNTGAEFTNSTVIQSDSLSTTMDGFRIQTANPINSTGNMYVYYPLRRAPGFFDVVCYTGTGVAGQTFAHNLGVAPELMIIKKRSSSTDSNWCVYAASEGPTKGSLLNFADEFYGMGVVWNNTAPTASVFSVGGGSTDTNFTGQTHVAYLFASCPGVSKVGSYTGNGSSQTLDMGFTGGARFFLVKRTDNTGDWWVWDSARGIVTNADPALRLNSTAAEVTSADAVDTASSGIIVNQEATCNINVNGASYIYLGIA